MQDEKQIISATKWKMIEKISTKGTQIIIQIILARLLLPDDYGTLAILTVFVNFANVFVQSGFSTALIQKFETDELDFSTCLYASLGISLCVYFVLWICAPIVANFYAMHDLIILIRIISIVVFSCAVNSVQYAYISRKFQFKTYTIATFIASIIAGGMGVVMAYSGLGVWALVMQQILANYLVVMILFFIGEWKPKFIFSILRLKKIWSYGWKLLGSGIINSIYSNMYTLVVGKVYSNEILGIYNRAEQFPNLIVSNVDDTVQAISLPVLSQQQNEEYNFVKRMETILDTNALILVPMVSGLAAIAHEFVAVILTDKWLETVPFMQLICVLYMTYPIHTVNVQALKASGRGDILLLTEVLKKVIEIVALLISVNLGIWFLLVVRVILSMTIMIIINTIPTYKIYNYGFLKQIKGIWKCYISSLIMILIVSLSRLMLKKINIIVRLVMLIVIGILVFGASEFFLKDRIFLNNRLLKKHLKIKKFH